jgi:hypothetical protein
MNSNCINVLDWYILEFIKSNLLAYMQLLRWSTQHSQAHRFSAKRISTPSFPQRLSQQTSQNLATDPIQPEFAASPSLGGDRTFLDILRKSLFTVLSCLKHGIKLRRDTVEEHQSYSRSIQERNKCYECCKRCKMNRCLILDVCQFEDQGIRTAHATLWAVPASAAVTTSIQTLQREAPL